MKHHSPIPRTVPADHFASTLEANVDNRKLTDKAFRQFVRNTLPIVIYPRPIKIAPSQPIP